GEHRGGGAANAQPQLRAVGGAPRAQLAPTCCQRAHGKLLVMTRFPRAMHSSRPHPSRTPAPICGRACAFALLRTRAAITYKSYSLFKQPISFPRRGLRPGFAFLASLTRMRGGGAPRVVGCLRGTRGLPSAAGRRLGGGALRPIRGTPASRR